MAAKKKSAKKKTTKKKGVGAVKKEQENLIYLFLGSVTGAIGTRVATNAFKKQTSIVVDDKVIAGTQFAAGALLAWFIDHPFLKGVGIGMAGEGVVQGLVALEVIQGMDLSSGTNGGGLVIYQPRPNVSGGNTITPAVAGSNAYNFPQGNNVGSIPSKYAGVYN